MPRLKPRAGCNRVRRLSSCPKTDVQHDDAGVRAADGHVGAIEGANGVARPVSERLLADGERVLDVRAKLERLPLAAARCSTASTSRIAKAGLMRSLAFQ